MVATAASTALPVVFSIVPPCKTSAATAGGSAAGLLRMKETVRKPSTLLAKSVPRVLAGAGTTASNVEGDGGYAAAGDQVKTSRCDDDDREMVAGGAVYREVFRIRSYEVSADGKASMSTLMNHLQDTGLNHVRCMGLMRDGFGATPEMCKRDLIWVVTKMCLQIHTYASWGTSVIVDTWINITNSKNRIRREWRVCDQETGQTLLIATGILVVMNKRTRRPCKIPEQVREELQPYFMDQVTVLSVDDTVNFDMLDQPTGYAHKGLRPSWNDLDVNQHVNHVKYVSWIFESIPDWILKNYEAMSIVLEYHKECNIGSILHSFTIASAAASASHNSSIECQHALQLESGYNIIKGRTIWRLK